MHPDNKKALMNSLLIGALVSCFMFILILVLIHVIGQKGDEKKEVSGNQPQATQAPVQEDDLETITAVFLSADTTTKKVTVKEVTNGEILTFDYSGGTAITDKYDQMIVSSQIQKGMIVTISFESDTKRLAKLSVAQDIWEKIGITDLKVKDQAKIVEYMGINYSYQDGTVVLSNGEEVKMAEILPIDYVTVRGSEEKIYSVIITRGHGYIELTNEDLYLGGLISVGAFMTDEITNDLILTVREGTHTVTIENKKQQGNQIIDVIRNQTTMCDVNEFGVEPVRTGIIDFVISPSSASLFVDGKKTDHTAGVTLLYGDHEIEVSLGGYVTYQGILTVAQDRQTVTITLPLNGTGNDSPQDSGTGNDSTNDGTNQDSSSDNSGNSEDNSSGNNSSGDSSSGDDFSGGDDSTSDDGSSNDSSSDGTSGGQSSSGNSSGSGSSSSKNKTITIYWTTGADVYFDGEFVGQIEDGKLSVPKQTGEITVDLVLEGEDTVTYNIVVDDDNDNAVFEFPQ